MDANIDLSDRLHDPRIIRINADNDKLIEEAVTAYTNSKYFLAAHLYNVERFKLYEFQGLTSMAAYYESKGLAERTGKRALQTAREIADVIDLSPDKPLTKAHAMAWVDARRSMQLDAPTYQLLLPAPASDEAVIDGNEANEDDPAYQQLVDRMRLKFGPKGKTPGLLKKTAPTQKALRSKRIEQLLTETEKNCKLSHAIFTQNDGMHRSTTARRQASYYLNISLYYVLKNGENADACKQFLTYDEAIKLEKTLDIETLKETRPDVYQGLFGTNAAAE